MIESILTGLVPTILGGGPASVLSIFVVIIGYLVWSHRAVKQELKEKDDKIDDLLEKIEKLMDDQQEMSERHHNKLLDLAQDYQKGTLSLAEAMVGVKDALLELRRPT